MIPALEGKTRRQHITVPNSLTFIHAVTQQIAKFKVCSARTEP